METSEPLAAPQRERLGEARRAGPRSLDEVPGGLPLLLVANELLDCLPVRQFIADATAAGPSRWWAWAATAALTFGLVPAADRAARRPRGRGPGRAFRRAGSPGRRPSGSGWSRDGGAALLIDYGRDQPGFGDTLQALGPPEKVDPLACPAEADLTVRADFPAVQDGGRAAGAELCDPDPGGFLARLGIGERAEALAERAARQVETIGRQLNRLVGGDQMGELFKACCLVFSRLDPAGVR